MYSNPQKLQKHVIDTPAMAIEGRIKEWSTSNLELDVIKKHLHILPIPNEQS